MGSAFKNKGVQLLLDGVSRYLPAPTDVNNRALDLAHNEAPFTLPCSPSGPFVGLAFKLEEGRSFPIFSLDYLDTRASQ
jgi:elongation factor G